jgi:hypothetical protein
MTSPCSQIGHPHISFDLTSASYHAGPALGRFALREHVPLSAAVMLVGEAPGAAEDAKGCPFASRAGRFLDEAPFQKIPS